MNRLSFLLVLGAALAILLGGMAEAQRVEAPVAYQVRPGDTLIALSTKYLTRKEDYQAVQQLNQVKDPYRLPIGATLMIPAELLRIELVDGVISSFRGAVTVDGQPAAVGMMVRQGMKVETGADAFVTVKLPDGSTISLPSQSRIHVQRLRKILLTGGLQRRFRLEAGRSQSSVKPFRDPGSSFQVTTPLSVSAVRGTDFRVAVDESGGRALTEVVGGTVGVQAASDKTETAVPKAFGIISTPSGSEPPVALLPPPRLLTIGREGENGVRVSVKPVEGAKSYRVQLATDLEFQQIFKEAVTETDSASFSGLGSVPFFVRLTAIAPSGMEGLPATYAFETRVAELGPDEIPAAPRPIQISMTGDGRSQSATFGPYPTLR
ncbi:FecR family protein [Sphingomonas sp. SRS2]|uniref:FecR family protein n=1 Tax=Sphingomonas sp. SRS2 TaxID=133190 RepID=UPI000697A0AA|nr:FecR domain-containing protein [Sphingomonas sp. SRS2]